MGATNATPHSLLKVAQHCVGLATASLTIRKDAGVVPRQAVVHNWLADNCIHNSQLRQSMRFACSLVADVYTHLHQHCSSMA